VLSSGDVWSSIQQGIVSMAQTFAKAIDNMVGMVGKLGDALGGLNSLMDTLSKWWSGTTNFLAKGVVGAVGGLAGLIEPGSVSVKDIKEIWKTIDEDAAHHEAAAKEANSNFQALIAKLLNDLNHAKPLDFGGIPKLPGGKDLYKEGFGKIIHSMGADPLTEAIKKNTDATNRNTDVIGGKKTGKTAEHPKTPATAKPVVKVPATGDIFTHPGVVGLADFRPAGFVPHTARHLREPSPWMKDRMREAREDQFNKYKKKFPWMHLEAYGTDGDSGTGHFGDKDVDPFALQRLRDKMKHADYHYARKRPSLTNADFPNGHYQPSMPELKVKLRTSDIDDMKTPKQHQTESTKRVKDDTAAGHLKKIAKNTEDTAEYLKNQRTGLLDTPD
jgi:hypothetical protein